MRTWNSPTAPPNGEIYNIRDALAISPAFAANVANTAIRGELMTDTPGPLRRFGRATLRAIQREQPPAGFPSYGETVDLMDRALDDLPVLGISQLPNVQAAGVEQALTARTRIYNSLVARPYRYQADKSQGLEYRRDAFNESLSEVMREPEARSRFMRKIGAYADEKSQKVREQLIQGDVIYDYVIEGDGIHAANMVAALQETDPEGKVLVISKADNGMGLGGQFRSYGDIPVFVKNSRNKSVRNLADIYGLPKNSGDLNSPGLHAPLRLPDFVAQDSPENTDTGHMTAAIIALSGADILFTQDAQESRSLPLSVPASEATVIRVGGLSGRIRSRAPFARLWGAGTPIDPGFTADRSTGEVWRDYGSHQPGTPHPAEAFADKRIAVVGCGDTAKAMMKLLVGQGPKAAYGNLNMNRIRPRSIVWIAQELGELGTKAAFKDGVRSIYSGLAAYMPEYPGDERAMIEPIAGRYLNSNDGYAGSRAIYALRRPGRNSVGERVPGFVDEVITATGLREPEEPFGLENPFAGQPSNLLRDPLGTPFAPFNDDRRIVAAGPNAKLAVRDDAGVPENTASIWAASPAVTLTAYAMARYVKLQRQQALGFSQG
jgi:hypothetical protein